MKVAAPTTPAIPSLSMPPTAVPLASADSTATATLNATVTPVAAN